MGVLLEALRIVLGFYVVNNHNKVQRTQANLKATNQFPLLFVVSLLIGYFLAHNNFP